MALIFTDGFDTGDNPLRWTAGSTSTSVPARFNNGRFLGVAFGSIFRRFGQELGQIFMGYAINMGQFGVGGVCIDGDNAATPHVSVMILGGNSGIAVTAGRGGAILATSGPMSILPNIWYYMEVWVQLATVGGRCQVRLDGQQVIDFTGNTMNGGTLTTIDAVDIGPFYGSGGMSFDDIYVCDATGTTNNTFLGDIRVQTLMPTANGTSTQLAPTGSVNNWQNVSDIGDNPATYNSSPTTGFRDTYTMADVAATTGTIFGVQDNTHTLKTSAGIAKLKPALLSGATLAYDAIVSPGSADTWAAAVRETDPNTGLAWTSVGLNAVEFGGEIG